jgi:integrase/recombinase XerC
VAAAQRGVKAARDVALVGLLYSLGLRRAEVCSLDVEDFDRAARRLAVVGKGHSDADRLTVPVALAAELEAYLEQRSAPPVGPLFASADRARKGDGRLTPSGLAKLLRHLAGRAGAAVPVSPHRLRHSAVTDALEASRGDVRRVRVFARHAKIDTTLRYDDVRRDVGGEIAVMLSGALGSPRQAERDQEKEDCFDGDVPENASSREQKTDEE